jgi:hypothetical protein
LKARIDSKEFSNVIRQAARWSAKTGAIASECIWLKSEGQYLIVRTTTLDQDAILTANNFGDEDGEVLTKVSILQEAAIDTGGFVNISRSKSKLVLDYEDFSRIEIGTVADDIIGNFPVILEIEPVVSLNRDTLVAAASHTLPLDKTGLPIKSAVHIIPNGDQMAIVGTEGIIGYMMNVEGTIEKPLSIGASTLMSALMVIRDLVEIGIGEHRVQVKDMNSPSRIQFSSMQSPDPSGFISMFNYETTGSVKVSRADLERIRMLCNRSSAIDSAAEIKISRDKIEILGQDIEAEMEWDGGDILTSYFLAEKLAQALGGLRNADEYLISTKPHESGNAHFWYVDAIGRHFIGCASPGRFE